MCSEEIGRHPNHSQLPKLNKVTEIPQIAIPLVDEVLDTLGGGSVFSVFDLFLGVYSVNNPSGYYPPDCLLHPQRTL